MLLPPSTFDIVLELRALSTDYGRIRLPTALPIVTSTNPEASGLGNEYVVYES